MRARLVDRQPNLAGGLNLTDDPSQMQPNQLRKAVNVRLSDSRQVGQRRGPTARTHATALGGGAIVRGGTSWQDPNFVREYVMVGGQLYRGVYSLGMSWTTIGAGGFSSTQAPDFEVFRDGTLARVLYIADGGPLNKVTSGDVLSTNLAGTPNVTDLCVYNRRLYGITGQDEMLYASAADNGDTLGVVASGGIQARILTFGDQQLTAIHPLRGSLLLFHVSGISRWTGWSVDDIAIQTGAQAVSGDVGVLASKAVLEVEGSLVFPSDKGFFAASETQVQAISTPIEGIIRTMDQSLFSRIRAVHNRRFREACWYLPGYGVFVWNYRTNSWTGPWTGAYLNADAYAMWESRDSQNRPLLLWGGNDGFVRVSDPTSTVPWRDDVRSDLTLGDPIVMDMQFAPKYFGNDMRRKSLRRAFVTYVPKGSRSGYFWARCGGESVRQTLEATSSVSTWTRSQKWNKTNKWPSSAQREPIEVPLSGVGTYCDSGVVDDGEGATIVASVTYEAYDMGGRT